MSEQPQPAPAELVDRSPGLARRLFRNRTATAALVLLVLIVIACLAAPLIAPYPPDRTNLGESLQGPSAAHLLGTDQLGRDTLSRLLYGGRPTLLYATLVAAVALLIGVPLGLLSGYAGGRVNRLIMPLTEIGMAIPVIVVVIVVLSVFQDLFLIAMIALGLLAVPPVIRNIRGPVVAIRRELFIDAAVVAGLPPRRIVFRHVLPRVSGPVLVQAALVSATAVQFTAGLAYLGFGSPPPAATWGGMIAEGAQVLSTTGLLLLVSGGVLGIVVICLGLLGDGIRDATVQAWTGETSATDSKRSRRPALAPHPEQAAAVDPAALLSVQGLAIAFEQHGQETLVASDVSFAIAHGEIVGLVGESGCGKTTVARSIIGLLGKGGHIVAGDIRFGGRSILSMGPRELGSYRGECVSYVSQEPMGALDPTRRIGRQIEEVLRIHGSHSRKAARARTVELLERVQLPDPAKVAGLFPHELSGGMAQRVAIARALAKGPQLLIADEPTTALDVTVQAEILKLLRELRDTGLAILLISHDLAVVTELCDRAIVMYAGELVEQGTVQQLLSEPAHPYSEALVACRPTSATDPGPPLPTIPGSVPPPGQWPDSCRFAARCLYRIRACTAGPVPIEQLGDERASRCLRASELIGNPEEVETHA